MTAIIDTSVLLYFLNANTPAPRDPSTGKPVTRCKERVDLLITELSKAGERLIVPTPVLAEILVRAGAAGPRYIELMDKQRTFRIEPFGQLAAIEAATLIGDALAGSPVGDPGVRAKLKFDAMIVAVARVQRAETIYSDDKDIARRARDLDIRVVGINGLEPPERTLFDD